MENNKKSNHQMEINDLIDLAITNAVIRRGVVEEDCLALSDDEAARVAGGLAIARDVKALDTKTPKVIVAGFKPVHPPLIVGLIVQDDSKLA